MENLNKDNLVNTYRNLKLEEGEEVSVAQAKRDTDTFLTAVMHTLAPHKDVTPNKKNVRARLQLVGFGSVELRIVPARKHKNPQNPSAEPKLKPAYNKVVLNPGKEFNTLIN